MMNYLYPFLLLLCLQAELAAQQNCPNRCLDLDGTGDYVQSAVSPVTGDANFTMEARFVCTSTGSSFRRLMAFGGANTRFELGEIGGLLRLVRQSSAGTTSTQLSTVNIRNNGWHHVAMRRDGSTLTLFLDCDSVSTLSMPGTLNISLFRIGHHATTVQGTTWWDGLIDEVRIWNVPRTAADIQEYCNCGLAGDEPNLALYYDFDQAGITAGGNNAGQTTVQDETANNNDGTLFTFALDGSNSNWVCGDPNFSDCAGACPADFGYNISPCATQVQFVNITPNPPPGVPAYGYLWSFGDGNTSSQTNPTHTYASPGVYEVCLSLLDAAGTILCTTCHQVVVQPDLTPPNAVCVSTLNVAIGAGGTFVLPPSAVDEGSFDNCGICSYDVFPGTFSCPMNCPDTASATLVVTDCAGNTSSCFSTIFVTDNLSPVITCPPPVDIIGTQTLNGCFATFTVPTPMVADNCTGSPQLNVTMSGATSGTPSPGASVTLNQGLTVLTYFATDACDNMATCTLPVTMQCIASCSCGDFSGMTLQENGQVLTPLQCDTIFTMPCPVAGRDFEWRYFFGCEPNNPDCTPANMNYSIVNITTNTPIVTNQPLGGVFAVPIDGDLISAPGVYEVTLEGTCGGQVCRCKIRLVVDCGGADCSCGVFTGMTISRKIPAGAPPASVSIACNESAVMPCPVEGFNWTLRGNFNCIGNCSPSNLQWDIHNSVGGTVASGSGTFTGNQFGAFFSGTAISSPGAYTLTLSANCGQDVCTCTVTLLVDCPPDPEPVDTLCGRAVVTCFSGVDGTLNNYRVQNLNGYVLAIIDNRNWATAPLGSNWTAVAANIYHHNTWIAKNLGEVFGIALDDNNQIYVTGTTLYGVTGPSYTPSGYNIVWGPGGPAGIYRVDAVSGAITNLVSTGPYVAGTPFIPNDGAGLGNICYSLDHRFLYVTNFYDGMIYKVDPNTGNVMNRFDPFSPATAYPGTPRFAPLGERIWGVGYNQVDKRLYFGLWKEYSSTINNNAYNEIYSVLLNGAGDFVGTEVLEKVVTEYTRTNDNSSPVSDIAFSQDGKMLIAQRTMQGDIIPNNMDYWAHNSCVIEYERVAGNWTLTLGHTAPYQSGNQLKFRVGNPWAGTNSAGGVDYGYESFASGKPQICDNSVWCTGDALSTTHGSGAEPWLYGLQGMPATGGGNSTGVLIDFNNNTAAWDKSQIGDVEIFKCLSCLATPPCDSIQASVQTIQGAPGELRGCCYVLNMENAYPNTFATLNISVAGAEINVLDVTPASGWAISSFVSNSSVQLEHNSGYIPAGVFSPALFCLSNISAPQQVITLQYLDAEGNVLCEDEIRVECDFCIEVVSDTLQCAENGQLQMTFCVTAAGSLDYSIQSVVLTPPPGVTFSPAAFSLPPLAPGATHCTLTTTVNLGSTGLKGELCFGVTVHEGDVAGGDPPLRCCMIDHCMELPDCLCDSTRTYATFRPAQPLGNGLCCYDIVLTQPAGAFVSVETELLSAGSVFSGVDADPNWNSSFITLPTDILWTPNPAGTLPAVTTLPTVCFAGTAPQVLQVAWMTADSTFCYDELQFNCGNTDCAEIDSFNMQCEVIGGSLVNFYFNIVNNSGLPVTHAALVNVSPAGIITGPTVFPVGAPLAPGATSPLLATTLNAALGTDICFQINLYYMNPGDSLNIKDCCLTDEICLPVPDCQPETLNRPIAAYPNPVREELVVFFSQGAGANGRLRMLDVAGRLISEAEVPAGASVHQQAMTTLPAGMYFLEFLENDRRVWSDKVIKQ